LRDTELLEFNNELSELAKEFSLEFSRKSLYHFHLKGVFLLNIYPTKKTVYVQGTNGKASYSTIDELIDLANGESDLEGVEKGKRVSGRARRKALWSSGVRKCFVCDGEFTDFEQTTLEHKVPLSKGGSNRRDNISLSHSTCNSDRGNSLSIRLSSSQMENSLAAMRMIGEFNQKLKDKEDV
jgi:hypothetical protein